MPKEQCEQWGKYRLEVHHIKPVKPLDKWDRLRDAHDSDNLITLCRSCHSKWETREPEKLNESFDVEMPQYDERRDEWSPFSF